MSKRKKLSVQQRLLNEIQSYSDNIAQMITQELLQKDTQNHLPIFLSQESKLKLFQQQAKEQLYAMSRQIRQAYDDYVIAHHLVPWNKNHMDIIDFRDSNETNLNDKINQYLEHHQEDIPFIFFPTFAKGILYAQDYEFCWEIMDVNTPDKKSIPPVKLAIYYRLNELQFSSYGTLEFQKNIQTEHDFYTPYFTQQMDSRQYHHLTDIQHVTDDVELWNQWKEVDMKIDQLQRMEYQQNPQLLQKAACDFALYMIYTNILLHTDKPTLIRKNSDIERKLKIKLDPYTGKESIKRIREIHGIRILSEKSPKLSTEEILRHYHLENWNVRGHIRHYKNGKTVYIKPTVHHRKALKGTQTPPVQTILHIQK